MLRTAQLRSLRSVDDMVGRVMRWLVTQHEDRNTLVIYIGDNGVLWGEHGLGSKGYPYLPDLRVPLLMRWPGHLAPGSIDNRLAANIDLAPTILDATGATPHHPVDGRSLLRSWTRPVFLAEYWLNPNPSFPAPTWGSLVSHRYQYIEYNRNGKLVYREYYDLVHDPWELSNLYADGIGGNEPDTQALHTRLAALRHCIGTACR
jgi:arylsulfatase A-like enzyme